MPLARLKQSGRPYGLSVVAKAGQERTILAIMSAYEANFDARALPDMIDSVSIGQT
jgi:Asp-tRNA(Asn)/Glu-tRNA(Gln) amidotransferase A subunit family amidase